jgi:hypothetical protein
MKAALAVARSSTHLTQEHQMEILFGVTLHDVIMRSMQIPSSPAVPAKLDYPIRHCANISPIIRRFSRNWHSYLCLSYQC